MEIYLVHRTSYHNTKKCIPTYLHTQRLHRETDTETVQHLTLGTYFIKQANRVSYCEGDAENLRARSGLAAVQCMAMYVPAPPSGSHYGKP